ncbi:hypothetical protein OG373_33265 [Streptomyces avidinii]|uniref:hypothetical protein n=1 Tax=Streptomyces avidinii TaxID=1895 RepID=UPI003863F64C|nr:hypothetical protein OG373_33265 [Streptomyces avidinii]
MTPYTSTGAPAPGGPAPGAPDGHGNDHGHDCRPRLRRAIAVTAVPRGLVVEAVGRRHLFAGADAADILPRLLLLLDGTRDRAAVAAELGLDVSQIDPVMAAIEARALLEPACPAVDAAPPGGAPVAIDAVADFLSRTGPPAAVDGGSSTAAVRLAAASVALAGPPEVTRRVAEDLAACGVGRVTTVPPGGHTPDGPVDLFVVCDDATAALDEAARSGAAGGFEVLRYAIRDATGAPPVPDATLAMDTTTATDTLPETEVADVADVIDVIDVTTAIEVGPRFLPGHTACTGCFRTGHERAFPADRAALSLPPATAGLVAGLVAEQVTAVLAGTAQPLSRRELRRLTLSEFTSRSLTVVPEPGCPDCGPIGAGAEQALDTVEWLLQAAPPERFTAGAGTTSFEPPAVLELATSPRRALPVPETAACPPGLLDERALSVLLSRTAGFREAGADTSEDTPGGAPGQTGADGGLRRRWAPNGGNLGSVRLFLLTETHLPALPGTVFAYDDETGELIAVRSDSPPLSELLAGTPLAGRPVRAALVFTGALHRLWGKYYGFSTRLTHLDSGCAMAQAALVAAGLGLHTDLVAGDTGALVEHLDLDPADRLVTGILGIYGRGAADAARTGA